MLKKEWVRLIVFILGVSVLHNLSYGQIYYQFKGRVINETDNALIGATVMVPAFGKGAVSGSGGSFTIDSLPLPIIVVEVSFLGYNTLRDTISLVKNQKHLFRLVDVSVVLDEVVVSDDYSEYRKRETSLDIEVVNADYLRQNLGGSLVKSLERLPGVTTIDIGSGQSKPVIRGLGFNRVVVVENNIKHEAQQWGADHGLEIDQYAVDHIEVIKGPASLMYGSDAIGGIIDMKSERVPEKYSYGGTIDLSGKTNNDFLGASIALFARKKHIFATARATLLDYGDYKVPADSVDIYNYRVPLSNNHLRNTAGQEYNLHSSFGIVTDQFQSSFFVSNVNSRSGFFANAHGLEPRNVDHAFHDASNRDIQFPYQKVNHFKVINRSSYWWNQWRVEFDLGYQRNFREEWSQYVQHGFMPPVFPENLNFNPEIERQFQKEIYSGNAKFFYRFSSTTQISAGVNSEYQGNEIDGRGFIIPTYRQFTLGGFAVAKHHLSERSLLQTGIRYDFGQIKTASYRDWFVSPVNEDGDLENLERSANTSRDFSNFTWSVGYNYNPGDWSYKINVGKSFRMPIAKELAANGVNYHRFSYEVGDANLSPETSYQLDVGIDYSSERFAFGASPFVNYFSNYIYLNPTPEYDRLYGFGNQVFEYTESKVLRYGAEVHGYYKLLENCQVGFIGEYVYAEQLSGEKKGFTLPFSPPASGIFNVRYQNAQIVFIRNAYLSLDYKVTASQNRIVPPEEPTDGYQVVHLSLGGNVILRKQKVEVSLQVQNLLNARFFNHTSYYRLINVPEPGRNFIMNIAIPFSAKIKQN